MCRWLTSQKWFDHTILFFIALNCITLAMERPNIPPGSYERLFLVSCNYLFTVVFGLEMLVKVRGESGPVWSVTARCKAGFETTLRVASSRN